ncbi:MAG: helix-turn-helix transcriptional regulator, partial [Eggerthellaceae bacterium]|nr:helix-turn-helix transcriptional regulator [Eggerthellaceae bacterium]
MAIEDRIQEQRKMKGLSQEQFADVLGVSRQAVSKWESGQSLPEIEKLIAMCDLFGVSIDYILRGEMPQASARNNGIRLNERLSSLIVNTVAVMLFAVALFATMGQLRNDPGSGDIYGGL